MNFDDAVAIVCEQVEFDCFSEGDSGLALEMCLIIAEVIALPDDAVVKIDGGHYDVRIIRQAYSRLTHEHLLSAINSYRSRSYAITFKKAYMRTILYNSIFELQATAENDFAQHAVRAPKGGAPI